MKQLPATVGGDPVSAQRARSTISSPVMMTHPVMEPVTGQLARFRPERPGIAVGDRDTAVEIGDAQNVRPVPRADQRAPGKSVHQLGEPVQRGDHPSGELGRLAARHFNPVSGGRVPSVRRAPTPFGFHTSPSRSETCRRPWVRGAVSRCHNRRPIWISAPACPPLPYFRVPVRREPLVIGHRAVVARCEPSARGRPRSSHTARRGKRRCIGGAQSDCVQIRTAGGSVQNGPLTMVAWPRCDQECRALPPPRGPTRASSLATKPHQSPWVDGHRHAPAAAFW